MPNPVTHFEVIGRDGERLKEFYSRVFKWKINSDNPMNYGMVSADGGQGIGGGISGFPGEEGHRGVTFYVEVPDLNAALGEIEAAGGKIVMHPDDVPGGPRLAQFTDPEGNRIGLTQAGSMGGQQ